MNKLKEKILIIAAHPDDEVLDVEDIYQNIGIKKFKVIFIGEGTSCRYSKQPQ